jgi:5-methylcytosine-specific restriction endonuclease McrA
LTACLCGRPAKEGYDSCERHIRKGAWKGGKKYRGSYGADYAAAREVLIARWKADPSTVCAICGRPAIPGDPFQPDHVIPASRGGPSTIANMVPAHQSCNRRRGARLGAQTSAERRRRSLKETKGERA